MIEDTDLARFAIALGTLIFCLIILYHYVITWSPDKRND